jgi:hypothetical protein
MVHGIIAPYLVALLQVQMPKINERGYPESSSGMSTPATGHRSADRPKLAAKAA